MRTAKAPKRPPRQTSWRALILHWLATSLASVTVLIAAPARWETWSLVALVAVGAVLRRIPLLGDPQAPLEQLSLKQSVLIVIPAFPIAIGYTIALQSLPWVSSVPGSLLCATVFCLGLMNMVGYSVFLRRARS